jgi:LAO/AO transport system kinase
MEIAQVMVVNKADLAGADTAVMQLRGLLAIAPPRAWQPPILKTTARTGEGVPELVDAVDRHQQHLRSSGHAEEERRAHAEAQVISLARAALYRETLRNAGAEGILEALVAEVAARRRDPRAAAQALLDAMRARQHGRS